MSSCQTTLHIDLQVSTAVDADIQSVLQMLHSLESHCPVTRSHAAHNVFSAA